MTRRPETLKTAFSIREFRSRFEFPTGRSLGSNDQRNTRRNRFVREWFRSVVLPIHNKRIHNSICPPSKFGVRVYSAFKRDGSRWSKRSSNGKQLDAVSWNGSIVFGSRIGFVHCGRWAIVRRVPRAFVRGNFQLYTMRIDSDLC